MISVLALQLVAAGAAFTCTPVRVWDGDGPIWCAEGPRIRLGGIAARELDGSCRPGHPCPAASGIAARDALVRLLGGARGRTADGHILVRGPRLICRSWGRSYRRTVATCATPAGVDLSCAMVRGGAALAWGGHGRPMACGRR
jgi:endonuclease YncB( thermonuclease family)